MVSHSVLFFSLQCFPHMKISLWTEPFKKTWQECCWTKKSEIPQFHCGAINAKLPGRVSSSIQWYTFLMHNLLFEILPAYFEFPSSLILGSGGALCLEGAPVISEVNEKEAKNGARISKNSRYGSKTDRTIPSSRLRTLIKRKTTCL